MAQAKTQTGILGRTDVFERTRNPVDCAKLRLDALETRAWGGMWFGTCVRRRVPGG